MKRPPVTLLVLQVVLVIHTVAVCLQPVLAGYFLSGEADAIDLHGPIGFGLPGLAFVQVIVCVLYGWRGRGHWWALYTSLGLLVAEVLQLLMGQSQVLAVHVPLGVAIVIGVLVLTIWSFRSEARQPRAQPAGAGA
jgi:hypothetical protein